ncbi:MAG: hypothetical protein K2K50_07550, partial [Anaeroplasmataceae bacterium]|nr:hypothetical protein [Anaeroplasmataceae bacterium]
MKKIVSIFSLFILLFSCCSVAEVKDNNSRVSKSTGSNQPISFVDKAIGDLTLKTADPNYMKNHYLHLYQNYGYNLFGSCSQIAIGMLLSYYDSYWNDNI